MKHLITIEMKLDPYLCTCWAISGNDGDNETAKKNFQIVKVLLLKRL